MNILRIIVFLFATSVLAQSKVGTINIDFVITKMPEIKNVETQLNEYTKELDTDLNKKLENYQAYIKQYQEVQATLGEVEKKKRQDSIISSETDIAKYRQNASQLLALRRDELLRPLYQKIGQALEKIARAGGYTQVMDMNDRLVYIDERFDVTVAVLRELGVTLPETENKN